MKTLFQIIICIIAFSAIIFLYCNVGSNNDLSYENSSAYNPQGIEEPLFDFENTQPSDNELKNYNKYRFRYEYILNIDGAVDLATLKIPVPNNENKKQYITELKIQPKPFRTFTANKNTIAEYKLQNLQKGKQIITIDGIAHLKRYDIIEAKKVNKNISALENLENYLKKEFGIEVNDPHIQKVAKSITGKNQTEIVQNIYEYVRKNINYADGGVFPSAKYTLQAKQGKCGEFSAAMVALCRAKNIPARVVSGNIARKTDTKHTWVEVYFTEYGWVFYDPTIINTIKIEKINGMMSQTNNAFEQNQDYISSIKNDFTSYNLTYTNTNAGYEGSIKIKEKIYINKIDR